MNLAAGETVTEVEVFEVCLSAPQLDEAVLRQIDKKIPDHVYENFVRQIAGEALSGSGETLKESVERDEHRQQLQKQIAALQVKVRRKRQLNK